MVKGIINAFDYMELCFVINLTKDENWAMIQPPIFALGMTKKKLISPAATLLLKVLVRSGLVASLSTKSTGCHSDSFFFIAYTKNKTSSDTG